MGASFKYTPYHPLTRRQLAPAINFSAAKWNEVRNDNAAFEGTVTLPRDSIALSQLKTALEPDESAIYVKASDGTYPFGGVIVEQTLDWNAGTVTIIAQSWRAWLYSKFLAPKIDLSDDVIYTFTAKDQLYIAQQLVAEGLTLDGTTLGVPAIAIGSQTSGRLRDFSLKGTDFKYIGEAIDSVAQLDDGFEWDIEVYESSSDGLPSLRLVFDYPERGGLVDGLILMQTDKGANMRPVNEIQRVSTDLVTRQWVTGAAQNNASAFAQDSDPDITGGEVLIREKVSSYSTVRDRDVLSSYARAERAYRTPKINTLDVQVSMDSPLSVLDYRAGDRARLLLQNGWYDIDLDAARIIQREINPGEGTVVLSLDLEDSELPEADTEGAIG